MLGGMSELAIRFEREAAPASGDHWRGLVFTVRSPAGDHLCSVEVQMSNTAGAMVGAHYPQYASDEHRGADPERVRPALIRYGVRRLTRMLGSREGRAALIEADHTVWKITGDEDSLAELFEPLDPKGCEWQVEQGRDLFCAAATKDKARVGRVGLRGIAPTTRPLCDACGTPDEEWLCSAWSHPDVRAMGARQLVDALCEKDRPEIDRPSGCHAGGHDCWERVVPLETRSDVAARSPLDLPESLDFLDATWRLTFGKDRRLVHLPTAAEAAGLGQPCSSREGFEARMSDLADVLDGFEVADELVPADHGGRGPLSAMKAVLGDRLEEEDAAGALGAVGTLQTVRRVRVALQHSDASDELLPALATLGAPAPPAWGEAWDRIRTVTAEALDTIRAAVRRVDVDGQGT